MRVGRVYKDPATVLYGQSVIQWYVHHYIHVLVGVFFLSHLLAVPKVLCSVSEDEKNRTVNRPDDFGTAGRIIGVPDKHIRYMRRRIPCERQFEI